MSVSQITSVGIDPIGSTYLIASQRTNQLTSVAPRPPANVDTVHLSGAALARSLQLQGYSVEGIAAKLGSSTRMIDQYLGVAVSSVKSQ